MTLNGESVASRAGPTYQCAYLGTLRTTAVDKDTGEQLLGLGGILRKGQVDLGDVCERLKKMARYDARGPLCLKRDVRQAISEVSIANGRVELM